jgi:hypothetical protein
MEECSFVVINLNRRMIILVQTRYKQQVKDLWFLAPPSIQIADASNFQATLDVSRKMRRNKLGR